jgi:hypothetical protein
MKRKAEHIKEEEEVPPLLLAASVHATAEAEVAEHLKEEEKKAGEGEDLESIIEQAILKTLRKKGTAKTACPSEIPRLVLKLPDWRDHMELTRVISRRLATEGLCVVLSKMQPVDPKAEIKGPIRLRATEKLLSGK